MRQLCLITILTFAFTTGAIAQQVASPESKPEPIKVLEIARASSASIGKRMQAAQGLWECSGPQLYIINYGGSQEIARREKAIMNSINFRCFDRKRVTLVRGGVIKAPSTVVWEIPPGAEYPEP